jgi:hypothetical protein
MICCRSSDKQSERYLSVDSQRRTPSSERTESDLMVGSLGSDRVLRLQTIQGLCNALDCKLGDLRDFLPDMSTFSAAMLTENAPFALAAHGSGRGTTPIVSALPTKSRH